MLYDNLQRLAIGAVSTAVAVAIYGSSHESLGLFWIKRRVCTGKLRLKILAGGHYSQLPRHARGAKTDNIVDFGPVNGQRQ